MTTANVYLTFEGNCETAFIFYKSVFGGEFLSINRFKEMPADGGKQSSLSDGEKIMHISLPISKETVLIGSDTATGMGPKLTVGNNFSISINTDSREKANIIFNSLSSGGIITMPINYTFWGSYFGMLTDKFGINWMVSFDQAQHK